MCYSTNFTSSGQQNFQPIINENAEISPSTVKVKSLSRNYFKPLEPQQEKDETSLLLFGFQFENINKENEFDFKNEISKINQDSSVKDKDQELAQRFYQYVNPGKIPDGHCASCAFCTHLHFIGHKLEEAKDPEPNNYKQFGDWFCKTFFSRFDDKAIDSKENETYKEFKDRIEEAIKSSTISGEAVLISIGDGTHWFNGYNDGERIWFIDSQTGKGFNLYSNKMKQLEDILFCPQTVNIIKVTPEDILDYETSISIS